MGLMTALNLPTLALLDQLTMAIGEDNFGSQLVATVHAVSGADHIMAFAFSSNRPPRLVVSAGNLDEAAAVRAATLYAGSLYLLDPNYAEVRAKKTGPTSWFDFTGCCDHFREAFLDAGGIGDCVAFATAQASVIYYVLAMRRGAAEFAPGQRWMLMQLGEVIAANIGKHFSYMHALTGQNHLVIDRVIAEAASFAALTPRERRVCLGILTGYTSESIAINLEISINSVLTYRKRLYEKLGISSQNELFVKMIGAMVNLSRDEAGISSRPPTPLSRATLERTDARFDEYYMAEAFILDDVL